MQRLKADMRSDSVALVSQTASTMLVLIGMGYFLLAEAMAALPYRVYPRGIQCLLLPAKLLGLEQRWAFFAPRPLSRDGWLVACCDDSKGGIIWYDSIGKKRATGTAKPVPLRTQYPNFRWRQFALDIFQQRGASNIRAYACWLSTRIAAESRTVPLNLKIYFFLQDFYHPDDGVRQIQVFPITKEASNRAVFVEDLRYDSE